MRLPKISHWYSPSYNGDFRLIAASGSEGYRDNAKPNSSVLELVDVTPAERELLNGFLDEAARRGWTAVTKVGTQQKQEILLTATVADAGKLLISKTKPADATITAIKSAGGKIEVIDNKDLLAPEPSEPKAEIVTRAEADGEKPAKPAKAATVSRPTPCCPQCVPGSVERASEVLSTFMTPEQHKTWAEHRYVTVKGGKSGHRYVIAHRHSPLGVQLGRVCFDLDDGGVLHFHDNSVPPEEEVLATMLIMQHREHWLRNEATCLGRTEQRPERAGLGATNIVTFSGWRHIFKNPFGGGGDGVESSLFTESVGRAMMTLLGGDS